jgi:hypothetical protein
MTEMGCSNTSQIKRHEDVDLTLLYSVIHLVTKCDIGHVNSDYNINYKTNL